MGAERQKKSAVEGICFTTKPLDPSRRPAVPAVPAVPVVQLLVAASFLMLWVPGLIPQVI